MLQRTHQAMGTENLSSKQLAFRRPNRCVVIVLHSQELCIKRHFSGFHTKKKRIQKLKIVSILSLVWTGGHWPSWNTPDSKIQKKMWKGIRLISLTRFPIISIHFSWTFAFTSFASSLKLIFKISRFFQLIKNFPIFHSVNSILHFYFMWWTFFIIDTFLQWLASIIVWYSLSFPNTDNSRQTLPKILVNAERNIDETTMNTMIKRKIWQSRLAGNDRWYRRQPLQSFALFSCIPQQQFATWRDKNKPSLPTT